VTVGIRAFLEQELGKLKTIGNSQSEWTNHPFKVVVGAHAVVKEHLEDCNGIGAFDSVEYDKVLADPPFSGNVIPAVNTLWDSG